MMNKNNVEDIIGLSATQEGMLFHYLQDVAGGQYFEQLRLEMSVKIDVARFEQAWNLVVANNGMLRTVFRWEKLNNPVQIILKQHKVDFKFFDGGSVEEIAAADKLKGFDLTNVAFRVTLIKRTVESYVVLVSNHHILYDGWSNAIILKEFFTAYDSLSFDEKISWPAKASYKQFVAAVRNFDKVKHQAYWHGYLNGFDGVTPLPFAKKGKRGAFAQHRAVIELIGDKKATLASLVYAAWGVVLGKCTNSDDVVFGKVVSGRGIDIDNIDNTVGLFINTVPLRVKLGGSVDELLQQVSVDGGYDNTPLVDIKEYSGGNELFSSIVVVENYPLDKQMGNLRSLRVDGYAIDETTNYDLTVSVLDGEIEFRYNTGIFEEKDIRRLSDYFSRVLMQLGEVKNVNEISVLSPDERKLLDSFNETAVDYPLEDTIVSIFEKQVSSNIAVGDWTYAELNERANELADYLRKGYDVKPDNVVGVKLARTEWMVAAMLGVLKSGGAYVPLDPAYPQERIDYMVEDSKCVLVIDDAELNKFRQGSYNKSNPGRIALPSNLAYVIYTSGSTGKPKGVMIEHRSVAAFLHWCKDEFAASDFDVTYAATSICFDLSIYEIFYTLSIGKKIKLLNNALDIAAHLDTTEKILLNTVPGVIGELLEQKANLSAVKVLNMAGEPIPPEFMQKLPVDSMEIRNLYGPTEDTTYSTVCRMQPGWQSSIGRPKANTQVYILDKWGQPCAIGVAGELYIAGHGLARGYLNRDELTAEKFANNMYRTGDLGYWLPSGEIAFIGRADNQVKVRGYRIELGEIEQVIRKQQSVRDCLVMAVGTGADKSLCAYVIGEVNAEALSKELPAYMIPSHYVQLDKFPLTANGKIDRKALPAPNATTKYIAPADSTEEKLATIWSELLNIPADKISTNSNFFSLGGHSLKATRLISRIHKEFEVNISLQRLFKDPSISALASFIRTATNTQYELIPQADTNAFYRLSPAQERMYILQQLHPEATVYNMPAVFSLPANVTATKVQQALQQLITRHESLRTSFETKSDVPVQRIHDDISFDLDIHQITNDEFSLLQKSFVRPFDLYKAPLVRAAYVKVTGAPACMLVDMHHIISDGVSQSILEQEFLALLRGEQLQPLRLQYKDYANWINSDAQQSRISSQEKYWLETFAGELPVPGLPYDFARPLARNFEGDSLQLQLTAGELHKVQQLCQQQEVTLYMFLLAAINIWLAKLSGEEDVIVLSPVAARRHEDLESIIGLFINTLALRSYPSGDKVFKHYLQEVKQSTLKAYEHQEYGFETLIDKLQVKRDLSRNPLSDVMFVLQNHAEGQNIHQRFASSKFDLTITAFEQANGLLLDIDYSTQLFTAATMQRLVAYLKQVITTLSTEVKISDIELISPEERNRLIYEFNGLPASYPRELTLTDIFQTRAASRPDDTAVVSGFQTLTYSQLNEHANQLANSLRKKHSIQPDDRIGLLLNRSEWMIVAILAVLKTGAAYVPIDPNYPSERIEFMITDSNCVAVINETTLEQFRSEQHEYSKADLPAIHTKDNLAYVIYTSGTTGKPKGTLITHKNVVRLFFTDRRLFNFGPTDVWTFFHSYCFDFSVWEMYGALLFGGKLIVVPSVTARDSAAMLALLQTQQVTVFNQTPSSFYNIIHQALEHPVGALSLRYVIFGGEALSPARLAGWHKQYPQVQLINMYGITETTVHVTFKQITEKEISEGRSNIGKPIPTLTCYVLDKYGKPVPTGVFGELYVGGEGVARGYLNRDELTQQRFIQSPFVANEQLYRSGDKARWLNNGDLEYGGRLDEQVKIRGYRIELAEIERTLLTNSNIKEAAVVVQRDNSGEPMLVAYFTSNATLVTTELKQTLTAKLPDYMLPAHFIQLTKLPLTANGKLDKKSLPAPTGTGLSKEYVAPRTAVEKRLAAIWSDVLGLEKDSISIEADFFEIGGHSLKAYTLTAKIHKEFDVRFPLAEIFRTSTIKQVAEYIMALDVARNKKENQPIKKSIVKI
jgi:amino acid adenylation domain-containing protein